MPCITGMGHHSFSWKHSQLCKKASKWHGRHEWRNERPRDPDTKNKHQTSPKTTWRIIRDSDVGWNCSYLPHVSAIPPNIDKGPWKSQVFLPKWKIGKCWVSEKLVEWSTYDQLNRFLSCVKFRWDSKYESKFCRHQSIVQIGCEVFWKTEISPKNNDKLYFLIPTLARFSSLMYVLRGS